MRVSVPAKTVLSDLPLKQEKAKVTLQLVVNTGNIQIMTVASLEDRILRMLVGLEQDYVKLMRGEHGHEDSVLTSNQTLSRATDELPEHEQSSPRLARVQRGDRCNGRLCNEVAGKFSTQTCGIVVI